MSLQNLADIDYLGNLLRRHGALVKNRRTAMRISGLVSAMNINPRFSLRTDEDMKFVDDFVQMSLDMEQLATENEEAEKENLTDENYGLVKTKPIYTHGIGGSNEYLRSLETVDGLALTWERRGSTPVDGVNGMVDIYDSILPDGVNYKTLYVNMYGTANSIVIPRGFRKKQSRTGAT